MQWKFSDFIVTFTPQWKLGLTHKRQHLTGGQSAIYNALCVLCCWQSTDCLVICCPTLEYRWCADYFAFAGAGKVSAPVWSWCMPTGVHVAAAQHVRDGVCPSSRVKHASWGTSCSTVVAVLCPSYWRWGYRMTVDAIDVLVSGFKNLFGYWISLGFLCEWQLLYVKQIWLTLVWW